MIHETLKMDELLKKITEAYRDIINKEWNKIKIIEGEFKDIEVTDK